jgi:hypothetical protein
MGKGKRNIPQQWQNAIAKMVHTRTRVCATGWDLKAQRMRNELYARSKYLKASSNWTNTTPYSLYSTHDWASASNRMQAQLTDLLTKAKRGTWEKWANSIAGNNSKKARCDDLVSQAWRLTCSKMAKLANSQNDESIWLTAASKIIQQSCIKNQRLAKLKVKYMGEHTLPPFKTNTWRGAISRLWQSQANLITAYNQSPWLSWAKYTASNYNRSQERFGHVA